MGSYIPESQTPLYSSSKTRHNVWMPKKIQNQALRHITGAYKSVPEAVLQNEADIPPLALYTQELARQHAQKTQDLPVTQYIKEKCNQVAQITSTAGKLRRRFSCA
ncbi:hypothetical protein M433DRAFT_10163 [Acidomyces richmondensis BFW]|nr:hypothetical protein M433DRAFT_10163 [Acidomyces richmondensis BFW]